MKQRLWMWLSVLYSILDGSNHGPLLDILGGGNVMAGKAFRYIHTMDEDFENCLVEKIETKKSPFPENSFVRITEKGCVYLVNTDYIISCEL